MKHFNSKIFLFLLLGMTACGTDNVLTVGTDGSSLTETLRMAVAAAEESGAAQIIELPEGMYSPSVTGEVFPLNVPSGIVIRGAGEASRVILDAEGMASLFEIIDAQDVVIEGLTITGGEADTGGGLLISNSSVEVTGNIVTGNRALTSGAAIYITGGGEAKLRNNLIYGNRRSGESDVHAVFVQDASPLILNNVITDTDGNGMIVRGVSAPVIVNNISAYNSGRGICELAEDPSVVTLKYNLFYANAVAVLLKTGAESSLNGTAEDANAYSESDGIEGNFEAEPLFINLDSADYALSPDSPAINTGDPDPQYDNPDGSRSTIGFTGGPERRDFF